MTQTQQATDSTSADSSFRPPGRLSDPNASPATDERLHPAVRDTLVAFGLGDQAAAPPVTRADDAETLKSFLAATHEGFEALYAASAQMGDPASHDNVQRETFTTQSTDGSNVEIYVYKPSDLDTPAPCVVYLHGGGMTILNTDNDVHRRWCSDLAARGMVAITVDYRNAWSESGMNPFPAGLEDCSAALAWIDDHRADLGITKVVLQGESGGANLALATALKANREDATNRFDGVFAIAPFISGAYGWSTERKASELPSLAENDGYFLNCQMLDLLAAAYDPDNEHTTDPLAWPYFATAQDVEGLPPHVITAGECDPLRDEGLAYYRTLQQGGVTAVGEVNLGMTHIANMLFRGAVPQEYDNTIGAIERFARSL